MASAQPGGGLKYTNTISTVIQSMPKAEDPGGSMETSKRKNQARQFNGIPVAWVVQLNKGKSTSVGETTPWMPVTIARKRAVGWNRGTTVILR